MTEMFRCGDHEALLAYLYDEGEPSGREVIAAHIARCAACAIEIESLRSTRKLLPAWTPPPVSLGFRITAADEAAAPPRVLRPAAWWRQPLPAWAQAAAALVIFAAGLTVGASRTGTSRQTLATTAAPAATVAPVAVTTPAVAGGRDAVGTDAIGKDTVSRADLVRLEQRLRALETAQARSAAAAPRAVSASAADGAVLESVRGLIEASEERQRRENITLIGNLANDFDRQRRVDLRQMEDRLGRIQDTTGLELKQHRDALNYVINVSQTGVRAR